MSNVKPKAGGPYSLFCSDCGCWVPNTANHEMRKEGYYAHSHVCHNGVCDMRNGEIKLPESDGANITVKEYNEIWYPLINNSFVFLHSLEHNIKKAESPEEALSNLQRLGWGPELQKFLGDAVSVYRDLLVKQAKLNGGNNNE